MTKLPHSYQELKKKDPEYARECLLRTLKETKNISQTARLWSERKRKNLKPQQGLDKIPSLIQNIKYNIKGSLIIKNNKKEVKPMKKVISESKMIKEVIDSFSRTTEEVFTLEELKKLLSTGRQLKMKFGVDVTAPDLHIGHAVNLWMYRKLQELGHKIIFLIGDFTTQIGDPTGKSRTRPLISLEEIKKNAEVFIKQAKWS